jgi:hypothetical protein
MNSETKKIKQLFEYLKDNPQGDDYSFQRVELSTNIVNKYSFYHNEGLRATFIEGSDYQMISQFDEEDTEFLDKTLKALKIN